MIRALSRRASITSQRKERKKRTRTLCILILILILCTPFQLSLSPTVQRCGNLSYPRDTVMHVYRRRWSLGYNWRMQSINPIPPPLDHTRIMGPTSTQRPKTQKKKERKKNPKSTQYYVLLFPIHLSRPFPFPPLRMVSNLRVCGWAAARALVLFASPPIMLSCWVARWAGLGWAKHQSKQKKKKRT